MIVTIDYTNYKGNRRLRNIEPVKLYWGATEYHVEPQWLLKAWDVEANDYRTFAMADIHSWGSAATEGL